MVGVYTLMGTAGGVNAFKCRDTGQSCCLSVPMPSIPFNTQERCRMHAHCLISIIAFIKERRLARTEK